MRTQRQIQHSYSQRGRAIMPMLLLSLFVGTGMASATVVNFRSLAEPGTGFSGFGATITVGGFTFTSAGGFCNNLVVWQNDSPSHPTGGVSSTSLTEFCAGATTTMTEMNNGVFDLNAIDLAQYAAGQGSGSFSVTFTGIKSDSSTVTQTFMVARSTGSPVLQHFVFSGFTSLAELRFTQGIGFSGGTAYQFNNIAVSDKWNPTGGMTAPRRDHTATLLTDGKVLVVGWTTAMSEVYDPATSIFTPTASTSVAHGQGATGTLLSDGRVLIVGGTSAPSLAETYNSTTQTFSTVGSTNQPHQFHTATPLLDGTVLIAGGNNNTAELYNPTTNTFTLTGSLLEARGGATAAALLDGRVLIAGGSAPDGVCLNSAQLYNPAAGTFSATGPMSQARCSLWWTGAPVVDDGKVLIVGGLDLSSAELFDPITETFSPTGSMAVTRRTATATLLLNGQVLVAGGASGSVTTNSAELYDPVSGTFTVTTSMTAARQQHTATLLLNGQVLVIGGIAGGIELNSAELFSH